MLRPIVSCGVVWIVFGVLAFAGCHGVEAPKNAGLSTTSKPPVTTEQVQALLPESVGQGRPAILDFNSRFCLSCQKLKPKLEALAAQNPKLSVVSIDIQHPRPDEQVIVKAFKVRTVPYVVFIAKNGEIKQVFLDDQPMPTLEAAARAITQG